MKIPKICRKSASFDREDAGWHVPNSIIVRDCVPDFRLPGGGVRDEDLTDLSTAFDRAISYTKIRINEAERHLRRLKMSKDDL